MNQIKDGIQNFNGVIENLNGQVLKDFTTKLYSSWIEIFFLSHLLFQESKELLTLKEFLSCELAKVCFENCGLSSEVENLKEKLTTTNQVKDYLLNKSTSLELKIHETTCENARANEQRRIMEIQAKSLEESFNESQNYSNVLEKKLTQLYSEYQAVQKSQSLLKSENKIIMSDAVKIMKVFDDLEL